ncbi:MAG TPA: homoserine dehydrogenase [Gemmatimonadaceae bacterium]
MTSVVELKSDEIGTWSAARPVRVALAGCGAVGSALLRELAARRPALRERHGIEVTVTSVLVRDVARERRAPLDRTRLTADLDAFLAAAAHADVVIEAIGGLEPARRIAEWTLRSGRELVTANKELLAACGSSLADAARRHGGTLRYDAAVGGGVPVLRMLDDALGAGTPRAVRGILNGTTNFVLGRVERGATVDDALRDARDAGFAEADASRDLDGRDAAAKIALVAWAAFGTAPEAVEVERRSLLPDVARYVELARCVGRSVRQVAECALVDGELVARVEPLLVARDSALAHTRDEGNRIEVHTGWSAPLCASGPGAGGAPTATALLSDLLSPRVGAPQRGRASRCSSDRRRFRWALGIRGAPVLLHRLVPACGLVHTNADATEAWTLVDDESSADIDRLLVALTAEGAEPVAARLDDDERGGAEQGS